MAPAAGAELPRASRASTAGRLAVARTRGLPHGIGEGLEIVCRPAEQDREIRLVTHDLPAARRGEPVGVPLAQVVAVRLGVGGERPDDGGPIGVDVGERRNGRDGARGARAAPDRAHATGR